MNNNNLEILKLDNDKIIVANRIILWSDLLTPLTDFESSYTKSMFRLPVKGMDHILGYVDWSTAKIDAKGLWVERVLNRRNKYLQMIERLLKDGLIGSSAEASKVIKNQSGRITDYPIISDKLIVPGDQFKEIEFLKKQLQLRLSILRGMGL